TLLPTMRPPAAAAPVPTNDAATSTSTTPRYGSRVRVELCAVRAASSAIDIHTCEICQGRRHGFEASAKNQTRPSLERERGTRVQFFALPFSLMNKALGIFADTTCVL